MTDPTGDRLLEFLQVMRQLRIECGWKAAQTHRSLVRYLLEEAHETAEAIESGDPAHLREELGDLLLQIWFHAVIAEESGEFTLDDVVTDIIAKMRRRNPHVFPPDPRSGTPVDRSGAEVERRGAEVERRGTEVERRGTEVGRELDPVTINEVWEAIKAQEKQRTSPTDGLPTSLPALLYADKVLDRLAREARGSVVPTASATSTGGSATSFGGSATSSGGSATSSEIGERLLDLVVEARQGGVDPEQALRDAVRRRLSAT